VAHALGGDTPAVTIACAGASAVRAAQLARQLAEGGAEVLLSFGVAGALDPTLDCGDLVVADAVLLDEVGNAAHFACHLPWLEALRAALTKADLSCRGGMLIGSHRVWREAADKEAIFAITEAVAIDMESGAVAAVAAEAGLPFLAVRAIADRAQDSLPALVETAVKPDGMPAVGRAAAYLLRRPWELPAVLKLGRQSERALARLRGLEPVKGALLGGF